MVGLSRSSIGRLAVSGYPGHIFVCKLRYGYGHQEHIEKLEILHSWYSDLNAYLPVMFKGKEAEYTERRYKFEGDEKVSLSDMMELVGKAIDDIYGVYDPLFEGQSMNTQERLFIKSLRAIKERLDIITAESKIIEGIKPDDGKELLAG
jgi:hypothetical protein